MSFVDYNKIGVYDDKVRFTIQTDLGVTDLDSTGFAPKVSQWYLLTGTYDGTTMNLYLNGALINSTTRTGSSLNFGGHLPSIGASDCCGDYFPATLDAVPLYTRSLSATQVKQPYQ